MRRDPPKRPRPLNSTLGFVLVAFCICARSSGQDDSFFENRVRPILAENCFKCHGGKSSKGGIRLDRREALVHKRKKGPVVVPGKPGQGRLLAAVRHTGEIKMPPKKKLAPAEIKALNDWIASGAPWPASPDTATPPPAPGEEPAGHWAFQKILDPPAPAGEESSHPDQ